MLGLNLPTLGAALVLIAVVATFILADAAEDIINGWGFGDDG